MDWESFYKGAISGATGLLLSHPIDTIKSNLQVSSKIKWNGLYRGVIPPLFGMGLEKAVVFGVYENMYSISNNITLSGAVAGLVGSFVVTPVERLKILYQTGSSLPNIRTLYRGFGNTMSREVPGFAIYFNVYHSFNKNNIYQHAFYGGLSGMISWAFIYPQDMIKTQIQASNNLSVMDIVKRTNGVRGFYKGFHLALLRAIPLHAGTFAMYYVLSTS